MVEKIKNHSLSKRQPIVFADKYQPQLFKFDQHPVFDEKPVDKRFAVELLSRNSTSVLAAETITLCANQIRLLCAKKQPFVKGDLLQLSLTGLYQKLAKEFFLNIPCRIAQVDEFDSVTHLVVSFTSDPVNSQFITWYQAWFAKLKKANKSDEIEADSFNFIYQYYKRVYSTYLPNSVLFSNSTQVQYAFASFTGMRNIYFLSQLGAKIYLPVSIIQSYIDQKKNKSRIPLYFWYEDECIHYFSSLDYPKVSSKKIIHWLKSKPQWRVLLICSQRIAKPSEDQSAELKDYVASESIEGAQNFEKTYNELTFATNILDISCLFSNVYLPDCTESLSANHSVLDESKVNYQTLSFKVKRSEPRFSCVTAVKLTTLGESDNITVQAESNDISLLGISVCFPLVDYPFNVGDSVMLEFEQWNDMIPTRMFKKKEQIDKVEYEILNVELRNGFLALGLKRNKRDTDPKFNSLVREKINEIGQTDKGERSNVFGLYQSLVASLWVNNNITGLVFFLARDAKGARIIQAVSETQKNHKVVELYKKTNNWSFLQQLATPLGLEINKIIAEKQRHETQISIGIYCYYDDKPEWTTKTDLEFNSISNKAEFINRAISYKTHFFYHCSLVPITTGKDDILNGESSAFVSLAAHRLKEIHEICRSLIAVGELHDMTRLIEFMYKGDGGK